MRNAHKQHGWMLGNAPPAEPGFVGRSARPCDLVCMTNADFLTCLSNLAAPPRRHPLADLLGYTPDRRESCADGLLTGHITTGRKSCADAYLDLVAEEKRKRGAQRENPLPVHGFCRRSRDWLSAMGVTDPQQRFHYERMGPITPSAPHAAPPTMPWIHAALELIEG